MLLSSQDQDIAKLLKACIQNKRSAQKELYMRHYSFGMSICMRYASSREDAVEILNDGFMKVFTYLKKFDRNMPFQPWLRRILINASIDHFKKQRKHSAQVALEAAYNRGTVETQLDSISYEEILELVRELPPAYRTVFNLFAIEGYKHEEIARKLNISVGTSKSNYFKAKRKLQESLNVFFEVED